MLLVPHWYQSLYMYWYCGYCWYTGNSHSRFLYQYVTGSAPVLHFLCTGTVGTVGTLVTATPHWYQALYVNVSICYWYNTGTAFYMYWYCGYCWYIGNGHPISLYQCVFGTALVLLFICTGTVDTVGRLVPATLFHCTNMLLVLVFICTVTVGTVGTLVSATLCLCTNMLLALHWY